MSPRFNERLRVDWVILTKLTAMPAVARRCRSVR